MKKDGFFNKIIKQHAFEVSLILVWTVLILWRLVLYFSYCVNYTDDDEALMWYGTVLFAHGHFPEPCFFGQNYGSMLESLLALPLYWLGWPLNYALPMVTSFLYILPFVFCSIWLGKKGKKLSALMIVLIPACVGWQYDVLTSVPIGLINGLPFTTIGMVMLCDRKSKAVTEFFGVLLTAFGCVQSITSFSIVLISLVFLIYRFKDNIRKIMITLVSGLLAGGVIILENSFYTANPEYQLYPNPGVALGFDHFKNSISNISELLGDFCAIPDIGIIVLPILLLVIIYRCIRKKQFTAATAAICIATGILLMLFTEKSADYMKGSVLFGQTRIFLFLPFVVLAAFTIAKGSETVERKTEIPEWRSFVAPVLICLCAIVFKGGAYYNVYNDESSALFNDSKYDKDALIVGIMPVKELVEQAELINEIALQYDVKAVSLRNGVIVDEESGYIKLPYKSLAYICSALYYDEPYEFFLPVFDRRTWVYMDMAYNCGGKMLLIRYPVKGIEDLMLVELGENESPAAWFVINHGMRRNSLDYYTGEF